MWKTLYFPTQISEDLGQIPENCFLERLVFTGGEEGEESDLLGSPEFEKLDEDQRPWLTLLAAVRF